MKNLFSLLALGLTACVGQRPAVPATAAAPAPADPAAVTVVAAAQRLFDAMAARDTATLRQLLHPQAQITGVGKGRVRVSTGREWVQSVGSSSEALRERLWDPRVEVAGELATLWAPYDFHVNERFSHCGTDAFQFVRAGADWQLIAVTFTVRQDNCPPAPKSPGH